MEFSPQKFREMAFQLLFSIDIGDSLEGDLVPFLMKELAVSKKSVTAAYQKAKQIWEKREELDSIISRFSKSYEFERIQKVERNVLRLALFELTMEKELDEKIAIAEAIRLCRKFSTPEGSSFVNAILDEYLISLREKQTAL